MDAHLRFYSRVGPDILGFTHDTTGRTLPPEYAPWDCAAKGGAVLLGDDPNHVSDANIVLDGIRRDGFFLAVGGYEDAGSRRSTAHCCCFLSAITATPKHRHGLRHSGFEAVTAPDSFARDPAELLLKCRCPLPPVRASH
jgi:hypothetical protein